MSGAGTELAGGLGLDGPGGGGAVVDLAGAVVSACGVIKVDAGGGEPGATTEIISFCPSHEPHLDGETYSLQ